jgi:hypothetical protein
MLVLGFWPQALRLGMTRVMPLDPFWEKTLTTALASPRESCSSAFGAHSRPKPVLTFAGAFRWLVSAFHDIGVAAAKEAAMLARIFR